MQARPLIVAGIIPVMLAVVATVILGFVPDMVEFPFLGRVSLSAHARGLTTVAWAAVVPLFVVLRKGLQDGRPERARRKKRGFWDFAVLAGLVLLCVQTIFVTSLQMGMTVAGHEMRRLLGRDPGPEVMSVFTIQGGMLLIVMMALAMLTAGWQIEERGVRSPVLAAAVAGVILGIGSEAYSVLVIGLAYLVEPARVGLQAMIAATWTFVVIIVGYTARVIIVAVGRGLARGAES